MDLYNVLILFVEHKARMIVIILLRTTVLGKITSTRVGLPLVIMIH